jgi:hypothetical protein
MSLFHFAQIGYQALSRRKVDDTTGFSAKFREQVSTLKWRDRDLAKGLRSRFAGLDWAVLRT